MNDDNAGLIIVGTFAFCILVLMVIWAAGAIPDVILKWRTL